MTTRQDCEALDRADGLAHFRERFALPEGVIYLDGNSLGALPRATAARMRAVVEGAWGEQLIRGWTSCGWVEAPLRVGEKIGRLIGARPGETLAGDSTSVNLFKLLAAALRLRPGRTKIVSEEENFPTDLYVAGGLSAFLGEGHAITAVPAEAVEEEIDETTAVVMLTHVNYRTGRRWDMRRLTRCAHAKGALMLWDLAHSAGAMPLTLADDGADFAIGCGYKYLNGGPGAPGFLSVAQQHHAAIQTPITGWFGHARPFDFEPRFAAAAGIGRLSVGTPPILGMEALECGVDLMLEAPLSALRQKSLALTGLFMELVGHFPAEYGLSMVTPYSPDTRGSQVCIQHAQAGAIMQALITRGVIGDFRAPDILRFGMAPLYNSFVDIWSAAETLKEVLAAG